MTCRLYLLLRHHLHCFPYERGITIDQFTNASFCEQIYETDAINWNTYTQCYRKQERLNTSLRASVKGLRAKGCWLAALQPPCALLGLPASLLLPSYVWGLWVAGPIISPWISLRRVSARLTEAGYSRAELWPTYSTQLWLSQLKCNNTPTLKKSILKYIFEIPHWCILEELSK